MGFGQLKIAVALFAVAMMVASVLAGVYFWEKVRKPEKTLLDELDGIRSEKIALPDPGADFFDEAVEMIREGRMAEARSKLFSIMKYHADSRRAKDAKRIIGEWNLDRLLSSEPMPAKTNYEVKRGDSLNLIAMRNECTVGYIMRANNMTGTTIHPGEQMVVFPLNFAVIVNVTERTLTLTLNDQFFKEYDVVRVRLPVGVTAPFATTITDKLSYHEDRRVSLTHSMFQFSEKWLQTKRTGFVIAAAADREPERAPGEAADSVEKGDGEDSGGEEEEFYAGVFVAKPDLEELFTLLRTSTPVSVID